jgi:hypothetical protein
MRFIGIQIDDWGMDTLWCFFALIIGAVIQHVALFIYYRFYLY